MIARFRIGEVFPADDSVSQFLTGLCLAMNDLTLAMQSMDRLTKDDQAPSRVTTYYQYLVCAYHREAAHFLQMCLADSDVESFLDGLSDAGKSHLGI